MSLSTTETAQAQRVRVGTIIGIAWSLDLINKLGKQPKQTAQVTRWGIPGDHHYGETRYSGSQRKTLPNNRPITVFAIEGTRQACDELGLPTETIPPGGMGENILTEGIGDLGDCQPGDRLEVLDQQDEPKVVLEVGGQNLPCSNLQVYHRLMTRHMMNRRGVFCSVLLEGTIEVGDKIALIKA